MEMTVMSGGISSGLSAGYSTFLRLRSDGVCCEFWAWWNGAEKVSDLMRGVFSGTVGPGRGRKRRDATRITSPRRGRAIEGRKARDPEVTGDPARFPLSAPRVSGFRAHLDRMGWALATVELGRTFLGRVLVWCLVALGLTCLAARTTRRTGAPTVKAILLACV